MLLRWRVGLWVAALAVIVGLGVADAQNMSAARLVRPDDVVLGNAKGVVTIVDFYDTSCGPCRAMNRRIERLIAQDKQVRYVPIDVPILGWQSVIGAQALVAARLQGRFNAMEAILMSQRALPTLALMKADAVQLGLNVPRFMHDIASPSTVAAVNATLQRGAALGIDEVPVVYIGHNRIPGAMGYHDLRRLVRHADHPAMTMATPAREHS